MSDGFFAFDVVPGGSSPRGIEGEAQVEWRTIGEVGHDHRPYCPDPLATTSGACKGVRNDR